MRNDITVTIATPTWCVSSSTPATEEDMANADDKIGDAIEEAILFSSHGFVNRVGIVASALEAISVWDTRKYCRKEGGRPARDPTVYRTRPPPAGCAIWPLGSHVNNP